MSWEPCFYTGQKHHIGVPDQPHRLRNGPCIPNTLQRRNFSCASHGEIQHVATQASQLILHLPGYFGTHSSSTLTPPLQLWHPEPPGSWLRPSALSWCTLTKDRSVAKQWEGLFYLTWFEAKVQRYACKGWKQKGYRKNRIQSCLQCFLH